MEQEVPLTTETGGSAFHCEGEVVTCARCGRPASECDGGCDTVLETRGHRVPRAEDLAAVPRVATG
jgi:hypothetical protein